jgi:LacI family transcriptional regulator
MHIVQKSKLDFMPKLQDVARRAGVSIATVSKVLSNTPYFSTETREKVLEAVKELGYRPHFAGRALSTGKTHIVGVVFPYIYDSILKDPLVLAIIEGIEDELNQQGYNLLLHTPRLTSESVDESYTELLRSGYLDGMPLIVFRIRPCPKWHKPTAFRWWCWGIIIRYCKCIATIIGVDNY